MGLGDINGYINENWHGGDIKGEFFSNPEMDVFEDGDEQKPVTQVKKPSVWNWKHALTRELMRGKTCQQILVKYRDALERFNVLDEATAFLDENFGLIGWLVVDVDNFDEKFGYDDMPKSLKAFNLYAINSTEIQEIVTRSLVSENDGTIDGFFGSDDSVSESVKYIDAVTSLPCLYENGINDDTERIMKVASMLREHGWMGQNEFDRISSIDDNEKILSIAGAIASHFTPKLKSDGNYSDVSSEYGVEDYELDADPISYMKDIDITGMKENTIDDIGDVKLLGTIDIESDLKESDFCDEIELGEQVNGDVDLDEMVLEDANKDEVEFDTRKKDIQISNKYEWNW